MAAAQIGNGAGAVDGKTPATATTFIARPLLMMEQPDRRYTPLRDALDFEPQSAIPSSASEPSVRAACIAGVGIAMLTYWDVHKQIERGELKRIVLADVKPLEVGIWAVYPTRTQMPARVRAFIDALRDRLLAAADAGSPVTRKATPPGN